MKLKKSQLKEIVKIVVREAVNEKCGGGHLAGGEKGKRMFKHIKKGYKGEKDPETASKIAAATVNKQLDEAGLTSEMGPESKESAMDDITRLVVKKGVTDPTKVEYLVSQLFKHQTGWDADPEAVKASIERNMSSGSGPLSVGPLEEKDDEGEEKEGEEGGEKPDFGGEDNGEEGEEGEEKAEAPEYEHQYDEKEEVKLLKVIQKVADQLVAMHKDMKKDIDEASYKTVAPRAATDAKEDKARRIQTEPKVNEASYKVTSKNETDTAKEDKARKIQTEPKVTENHKVQHRSATTIKDLPNDPQNVRDPEVPGP